MRQPLKIDGTPLPVQQLECGSWVQHLGKWRQVLGIECEVRNRVHWVTINLPEAADPAEQTRRKKYKSEDTPLVLTALQKRALDRDALQPCLPLRQRQSIELFLVWNMPEKDVAIAMGLAPTNPIGMYATTGLEKLLEMMDQGLLPRFDDDEQMLFDAFA